MEILSQSGVYCIFNPINNNFYIGSSKCISQRYANYKSQSKKHTVGKPNGILKRVFNKYSFENLQFNVLFYTNDYLEWEEVLIKLLNPKYNCAGLTFSKTQPNLGKKFSKKWKSKLGKSRKHSKETLNKIIKHNKNNSCKLIFTKNNTILNFNSWVEAGKYFNISSSSIQNSYRKHSKKWRNWNIKKISQQKKKVFLESKNEELIFNSASECDKFLDLWRGATSNAIRNHNGILHNYKVGYI